MTTQETETLKITNGPPLIDVMEALFFNPRKRLFFDSDSVSPRLAVELIGASRTQPFRHCQDEEEWLLQVQIKGSGGVGVHWAEASIRYRPSRRTGVIENLPELKPYPKSDRG